ncbi:XVIPCD domain-containing protein [Cognatilysobacter terrigena]|uniref:XVIPCD domain-containing protein n=1 Tax=Cognatilysobacter terrigena TaxID=2488749 RepID=UPI001060F48D|nr:XVIPCD domain-containing protein [Lysobacter terrigena]
MHPNPNAEFLLEKARQAGITDPRELANFMGQMQVECGGFRRMEESTHYSAERLLEVFGPHRDRKGHWHDGRNGLTTIDEARAITQGGDRAIANAVYGGTWGARNLGNTEPDDGWRFRGRGYVQLTGRDHYESMGRRLGVDLVGHPELAADRDIAARIAITYWNDRVRPNGHQFDVDRATQDINGGSNGLDARREAARAWAEHLGHGAHAHAPQPRGPQADATHARQAHPAAQPSHAPHAPPAGERDASVRALQITLDRLGYRDAHGRHIAADGHLGVHTREALHAFQRDHRVHGEHDALGPKTQAALHAAEAALVTSPSNPNHALFEKTLEKVREAEHARGIPSGPHSERIAAALTTELVRDGITRVDRVEFNTSGTLVRAVQVSPVRDEPGLNRATDAISARQASTQSIAESSRQLHEVAVNVQAQRQDPQFVQARAHAAPTPTLAH